MKKSIRSACRTNILRILAFGISLSAFSIQASCTVPGTHNEMPEASEQSATYHPGKFVWHDLLTNDVAAAREFYGSLFGWTFEQRDRFTVIKHDDRRIGSLVEVISPTGEPRTARWIGSLSVLDVDQAVEIVVANGGKVHEGPSEMKNRGQVAFVSDPHGAQLALIRSKNGDPQDGVEKEVGSWLWNELWTDNPDDSVRFYEELGGYTSTENFEGYRVLKSGERWRAGIRTLFERELEQRWVPVIKVEDTNKASKAAESLGGRVIVQTGASEDGDHTALLADPGGALFIVQEWRETEQAVASMPL